MVHARRLDVVDEKIRNQINMFLIKAGDLEVTNSKPLERRGQLQDFESAKRKAGKLLKSFAQVELVDSKTNECVYFQAKDTK